MSTVVLTALAVGMMLVLIMFAARTGPQRIVEGTGTAPRVRYIAPPITAGPPHVLGRHHGQGTFQRLAALSWVAWIIRIGLLVAAAWLAYRGVRLLLAIRWHRERPEPRPAEVHFDVLEDPAELVDEMREDADAQKDLLLDGSPRNAIVACWDRFEVQAARAGLARRPWETSSEFVLRLLDFVSADGGAVARLERLYHEARFSRHDIDEDRRAAAVEALETIHASLPTRVRAGR